MAPEPIARARMVATHPGGIEDRPARLAAAPGMNDTNDLGDKRAIAAFARDLGGLRQPEALIGGLASVLAALGFVAFNYGAGRKTESGGLIADCIWSTLDPAWIDLYAGNRYYRDDRLVRAAQLRLAPFAYQEIFATPPQSARPSSTRPRASSTPPARRTSSPSTVRTGCRISARSKRQARLGSDSRT